MTHADLKEAAIEKIARAWASIDGKADKFDLCKRDRAAEDKMGHYGGYIADAEELAERGGILSLIEENERMREALEWARPYVESQNKADHMTDGFGPRTIQPSDAAIEKIRAALKEKP